MYKDYMNVTKYGDNILDLEIIDTRANGIDEIITRDVVRGISIKDNKILVVYPKGDVLYGTPGGGIDEGETHEVALRRELREEVGANDLDIVKYLGTMKSTRLSTYGKGVFQPIHHYYLVDIHSFTKQELIEYEQDLDLQFEYIDIDEVIDQNNTQNKNRRQEILDFYTNQTVIFEQLRVQMKKGLL